jgi:hypothetical protein
MRCSNPRCRRRGYEIDHKIPKMTFCKETHREFVMHCPGDEGSPKGRINGDSCFNVLHVRLTLRYKLLFASLKAAGTACV